MAAPAATMTLRGYLARLPLLVLLAGLAAFAMLVPAAVATTMDNHEVGRVFLYTSILVLIVATLAGFALPSLGRASTPAGQLVGLVVAYFFLPVVLAFPVMEAVGNTRFINAYLDMLSCLTTTGAAVFEPERLAPAVHLWRGMVGWLGGFLAWVTALALLAPLNLGGFEVTSEARAEGRVLPSDGHMQAARPAERIRKVSLQFAPIYGGLTGLLWVLLVAAGEAPLAGAIHAMSTLSTSGISPRDGLPGGGAGVGGEILVFLFFFFALSRRTFTPGGGQEIIDRISRDREIRLAVFAVVLLSTAMFMRHWLGALEVEELDDPAAALAALWGSAFTVLSFLTTTGFVSESWAEARSWSGLPTPGLLLVGLVLMGGGVATTAGGIKLLRVYALYKHGVREMEKLVHPNSVASAGRLGRRIRREGAYIAWIFFMLFTISLAAVMLAFGLAGLDFEQACILAIAALTTTGPLAAVAPEVPISYAALSDGAKLVFGISMIVGRLETLVLIALFNPAFWRR